MADRPRVNLGSPLPTTPTKPRGGALQDLLQQFGSQSSAESATKTRRISAFTAPPRDEPLKPVEKSKLLRQRPALAPAVSDLPSTSGSATSRTAEQRQQPSATESESVSDASANSSEESSEDDRTRPIRAARNTYSRYQIEGLKMEARKKERTGPPRRSTRNRKDTILQSDTLQEEPRPTPRRSTRAPPPRKLDTARARVRDDIAQKTKAKANRFLVANKDYFLPLLPAHNYVSKLVASGNDDSIVVYERLHRQPKGVTATMKPYQLEGLSFLVHLYNNGFSGILGDEMGLGKTLQTLSLFQYLEEQDRKYGATSEELRPYLVVCPLSVLNSWVGEAQKWVPELKVLRFHGTVNERNRLKKVALGMEDQYGNQTQQSKDRKASRKAGLNVSKLPTEEGSQSYKIIVTTYDTFQADTAWFKHSFVWRYVVLDEGHKIKSSTTQISTALRHISSEFRLILTGTPLQNNLLEMWALLAWLYPDVFTENTQTLFKESFDLNRGKVNRKTMDSSRRLLELIMLRRMKDSPGVNLGLPAKEEVLLYVPLTPMQRFWYTRLLTKVDDGMLDDLFADGKSKEMAALKNDKQDEQLLAKMESLEAVDDEQKNGEWEETAEIMRQAIEKEQSNTDAKGAWKKLMNLVMQLRKCCSHPYLLPGGAPDPYYLGQHVIQASGKFILLEKLLKHTIFDQGKKVLIFSGFTQTLDCCEDMLALISNHGQDFKYLRLDGSTGRARRNLEIRMFNDSKSSYKVMLLSTRAGGLGINLTSAEDVIFLDEDWNPQITLQAEARAHRIGQTKKVTIYKLCTQGTVEEQMMGRIRKKLYLSTKITESMRNIHEEHASARMKGRSNIAEEMPEMNTSQLKTLVRRGAQTLSHPEIKVQEMVSWDLETMLQKCRDKPADPRANPEAADVDVDEEKWLSVMERVECAVFDGKKYQRQLSKAVENNILPDSVSREDRRKGKNTTVMIDGFAINKESLNCADWEAVPTFAGKDPHLAEPKREKRQPIQHEEHCVACFDGPDVGHMVECKSCPRAYHFDCLEEEYQVKVRSFSGFFCCQHTCVDCGKNTTDAGGLIYRCRWCPSGFCEDCLDWTKTELIGENLPEFEMLGEGAPTGGFYIKCPGCVEAMDEDEDRKEWMAGMEQSYAEQHEEWMKEREEEQRVLEQEQDSKQDVRHEKNGISSALDGFGHQRSRPVVIDDDNAASPPSLTDTSIPTPAPGESGVSTPRYTAESRRPQGKKRTTEMDLYDDFGESREEKRARLDRRSWQMDDDPLLMGYYSGGAS